MNESDFQLQVTQLAELLRYSWVHFRPARTAHGWATPVSGPLGVGFPDLVLVGNGRVIFAELKTDAGIVKPEQHECLIALRLHGAEAYLWRPKDFDSIVAVLRSARSPGRLGIGLDNPSGSGVAAGGPEDRGAKVKAV